MGSTAHLYDFNSLVEIPWMTNVGAFDSKVVANCVKSKLFVFYNLRFCDVPKDKDCLSVGLFTATKFRKDAIILDLGVATVGHEDVVRAVQPTAEYELVNSEVRRHQGAKKRRTETLKRLKCLRVGSRHILSYVATQRHVGLHLSHADNALITYIDLEATGSPALFLNSPSAARQTRANCYFQTYTDENNQTCMRIRALKAIEVYAELLAEYHDLSLEYLQQVNTTYDCSERIVTGKHK